MKLLNKSNLIICLVSVLAITLGTIQIIVLNNASRHMEWYALVFTMFYTIIPSLLFLLVVLIVALVLLKDKDTSKALWISLLSAFVILSVMDYAAVINANHNMAAAGL